jgi:DNA-binding transcriptional LysR family regulator
MGDGMSELETRQLRYFVAVAEELHFGRAAERLGMAQPPLSRAIRALERQLGVRLLERSTRHVALTPAGLVLLAEARVTLDAAAAAARRTRRAGVERPELRVALKAEYDGGLLPAPFDDRGLDTEPLLTEPRRAALAADDPLAAREGLRLADLSGRTLPDGTPADREGEPPGPAPGARPLDLSQIFSLIEVGALVWFPPLSIVRRHPRPRIAYRPVADLAPLTLTLAWPAHATSPAVAAFVRAATAVAAEAAATAPR